MGCFRLAALVAPAARPITLAVTARTSGRRAVDIVSWAGFVTTGAFRVSGREMVRETEVWRLRPSGSGRSGRSGRLLLDGDTIDCRSRSRVPSPWDACRGRDVPAVPGGKGRSTQRTRLRTRFPGTLSACIAFDRHCTVGCNRSCTALIPGPCSPLPSLVTGGCQPVTSWKFQLDRRWGRRLVFIVKSL